MTTTHATTTPATAAARARLSRPLLWTTAGVGAALTTGATAYLLSHDPHVAGSYPSCLLLTTTGLYCPACGGTRAVYDLLHGDVAGAFARNPLVPVLLALTVVLLGRAAWRRRGSAAARPGRRPMSVWVPVGIGVAVLVFGVLRNVPGWTWLSPM